MSSFFKRPENRLIRLLAINGLIGVFVSFLLLFGLFWANIGNLRVLVVRSDEPFLPVVMLAFGLTITLCSVVMGSAIMMLKPEKSDDSDSKGKRLGTGAVQLRPYQVVVPAPAHNGRITR